MNELQIFNNPEFGEIRTINENGVVLFCGSDVARALGYSRPNEAVATHAKGTVKRRTPSLTPSEDGEEGLRRERQARREGHLFLDDPRGPGLAGRKAPDPDPRPQRLNQGRRNT